MLTPLGPVHRQPDRGRWHWPGDFQCRQGDLQGCQGRSCLLLLLLSGAAIGVLTPQAPVAWEPIDVTPIIKDGTTAIPDDAIESIRKNKVALKGPLAVCVAIRDAELEPRWAWRTRLVANAPPRRPSARATSRSTSRSGERSTCSPTCGHAGRWPASRRRTTASTRC